MGFLFCLRLFGLVRRSDLQCNHTARFCKLRRAQRPNLPHLRCGSNLSHCLSFSPARTSHAIISKCGGAHFCFGIQSPGFLLERIFHTKWWDYTGKIGSIAGYVCLPMSLLWGAACLLVIYGIQPGFRWILSWLPLPAGWSALCLLTLILFIDIGVTTGNWIRLKKLMKLADDLKAAMLKVSDSLGKSSLKLCFTVWKPKNWAVKNWLNSKLSSMEESKRRISIPWKSCGNDTGCCTISENALPTDGLRPLFPDLKRHFLSQSVEQWLEHKKHHKGEDQ